MEADTNQACTTILSNAFCRRDVQANLYDRVSILPDRLDYALIPSSIYSRFSGASSPSKKASIAMEPIGDPNDKESDILYVTVDETLVYARFFADFGPLDLGQTVHFCRTMEHHLASTKVLLLSSDHPHKRTNVMTLLVLFLVIVHKKTPIQAIAPFHSLRPPQGFRDAACGLCSFSITVFDCACAVRKAMKESLFKYASFRLDEYEHYDKLYHGDINWIVPGKLLAFSGPQRERVVLDEQGRTTLLAHDYAKVFQTLGVSCVIRFNEPTTYDRRAFLHANIRHLDLHYPDGGNPTDEIMFQFIRTCERESGAVAVHCKAGLGRTGTNIAAYLMKKHRFTAVEAIAWCRLCRPGSIVGPQQAFLVVKQPQLWQAREIDDDSHVDKGPQVKRQSFGSMPARLALARAPSLPRHHRRGTLSEGTMVISSKSTSLR